MPFSIAYNTDPDYCMVTVSGSYDALLMARIRDAALEIMIKHDCYHVLIDCRAATVQISTFILYDAAKGFSEKVSARGVQAHKIKRAFVVNKNMDDFSLYENLSVNRGLNVQIFQNMDDAIGWLTQQ